MGTFNLSDAEYEIMEYLWTQKEARPLQAVAVYCETEKHHSWKQQTIYTFLTRLEGKGVATAVKKGHKRYYSAAISIDEFKKKATHQLLEESFDGSLRNFLAAFAGGRPLCDEDKAILREFLEEPQE